MATLTRRSPAPPPARPTSASDPLAPTSQEWRLEEREKAARRRHWVLRLALVLTLPFLAGGLYAFPLAYGWRALCLRWAHLRPWGVAFAAPAAAGLWLWRPLLLEPTLALVALPLTAGTSLPVAWTLPLQLPYGLGAYEAGLGNPFPVLWGALVAGWRPGVVCAGLLCAAWGAGGFLEGRRLRSRTPDEVIGNWRRAVKRGGGSLDVLQGLLLRGYVTLLYAASGLGKTELVLGLIATSLRGMAFCGRATRVARWYYVVEQADENFAPYLEAWGLTNAVTHGRLRIVTRSEANALWRAHGHEVEPAWPDLAPLLLRDAAEWGADVVVVDTWTDWSGATDNPTIKKHLAIARAAVQTYGYALLAIGHTNERGELYGGRVFHKLCEVTLKMEAPLGSLHPVRVLSFDKDRTRRGQKPFAVARDLEADPPCYREAEVPPPAADDDGAPQPPPRGGRAAIREVEPEWMRARALLPCTAPQLAEATGWPKRTAETRLKRWEEQGKVRYERTANGRAIAGTWRLADGPDQRLRRAG